jgi:hypothetical protein
VSGGVQLAAPAIICKTSPCRFPQNELAMVEGRLAVKPLRPNAVNFEVALFGDLAATRRPS